MAKGFIRREDSKIKEEAVWVNTAEDNPTAESWTMYDAGTESRLVPFFPKGGETISTLQPLYRFETHIPYSGSGNDNTVWKVEVKLKSAPEILFTAYSDAGFNEVSHPLGTPLLKNTEYQWRYTDQTYYPSVPATQSGWIDFSTSADALALNIPSRGLLYNAFKTRNSHGRGFPSSMTHYQAGGHARAHYDAMATGTNGLASFKDVSLAAVTEASGAAQTECQRILKCAWLYQADGNANALAEGLRRLRNVLAWSTGKYVPTNIVVTGSTGAGDGVATVNYPSATRFQVGVTVPINFQGCSNAALNSSTGLMSWSCAVPNSTTVTFTPPVGVTNGTYTCTMSRAASFANYYDDPFRFKLIALSVAYSAFKNSLTGADKDALRDHIGYAFSCVLDPCGFSSWSVPMWLKAFANTYLGRWPWQRVSFGGHAHEWMLVLSGCAAALAGDEAEFSNSHFGLAAYIPEFCAAASVQLHNHYVSNTELGGTWEGAGYQGFSGYFTPSLDLMLHALQINDTWWKQEKWRGAIKKIAFGLRKGSGPRLANGDDGYGVWNAQVALTYGCKTGSPYLNYILRQANITINSFDTDANWGFPHYNVHPEPLGSLEQTPSFDNEYFDYETEWYATDDMFNGDSTTLLVNVLRRGRWNHGLGGAGGFSLATGGRRLIAQAVNLPGTVGITHAHKASWGNSSRSHNCWSWNGLVGTQVDGINTGPQNRAIPKKYKNGIRASYLQLDLAKAYRKASYVHSKAIRNIIYFRPGLFLILDDAALSAGSYTFEWAFHTTTAPSSAGVGSAINLFGVTSTSATRTVDSLKSGILIPISGSGIVAPTSQVITDSAWPAGMAPPANSILNSAYPESPNGTLDDANHVYWHNYLQWASSGAVFAPIKIELGSNSVSSETASVAANVFSWSGVYAGRTCTVSYNLSTQALSVSG